MCAELVHRLLAYLTQPVFHVEKQNMAAVGQNSSPLAVLIGASEAVLNRLKEVRTDYEIVAGATADKSVTLIDLGSGESPTDAAALRTYAEQGGTLLVHRATARHQPWLESLTGKKVSVEVQPYQAWSIARCWSGAMVW